MIVSLAAAEYIMGKVYQVQTSIYNKYHMDPLCYGPIMGRVEYLIEGSLAEGFQCLHEMGVRLDGPAEEAMPNIDKLFQVVHNVVEKHMDAMMSRN
jgi:hypothetical protein